MYVIIISISIFLFISLSMYYERTYIRLKEYEHKILLVNRTSKTKRIRSLLEAVIMCAANIRLYFYDYDLKFKILLATFVAAFIVVKSYQELQNEFVTNKAVFIREGNFYFQNLISYSWNIKSSTNDNRRVENYDELNLVYKSKGLFYKLIYGEKNFEVKVHVKKEDVELVDRIIELSDRTHEKVGLN